LNYLLKRFSTSRKTNENFALAFIDCKEINGDILRFMDGVAFNVGAIRVPHYVKRRNAVGEDEASNFSLKSTRIKTLCNALFADLAKASEEESILIFVDSFEKVPQAAFGKEISEGLRNHFGNPGQNWLKIVIGGQNSIRADEGWERFRCVEIKHFDRDELEEFADKNLGIKEPEILDYLEKEWKGDPLELGKLVHLYRIDQGATIEAQLTQIRGLRKKGLGAADSEFLDRLASSLDAGTMNALRCCAVPRWFDAAVFRAMYETDVPTSLSTISELARLWFVSPSSSSGYDAYSGRIRPAFRFESGHRSGGKAASIPIRLRPPFRSNPAIVK